MIDEIGDVISGLTFSRDQKKPSQNEKVALIINYSFEPNCIR